MDQIQVTKSAAGNLTRLVAEEPADTATCGIAQRRALKLQLGHKTAQAADLDQPPPCVLLSLQKPRLQRGAMLLPSPSRSSSGTHRDLPVWRASETHASHIFEELEKKGLDEFGRHRPKSSGIRMPRLQTPKPRANEQDF